MIAKHKRLFILDFWHLGVVLAHAGTAELPDVARVIHAWIAEGVTTGELRRQFPFVRVSPGQHPTKQEQPQTSSRSGRTFTDGSRARSTWLT